MPKEKSDSSTLIPVECKLLISKLNFYSTEIQCTKCNQPNVFRHIGNSSQKPIKPTFECSICKHKPHISFFEREFKNLDHTHPYVPEINDAPNAKKTIKKTAKAVVKNKTNEVEKVIKPTIIKKTTTSTTATTTNENTNNNNNNIDLSNLQECCKSLLKQEFNNVMEKLKSLQDTTEKQAKQQAAMERTIVKLKKVIQLNNLQHEYENYYDEEFNQGNENDVEMSDIIERQEKPQLIIKKSFSTPPVFTSAFTYADITKQEKKVENTLKKIKIASRAYTVPIEEHKGYEYVYFPCKARISRKAQRKNLKILGAQNGRILDIHYPSGNVVALLVHKSYTQEIQKILQGAGIKHINNYDPTKSNIIQS
ncbi:hypothetical protein BD770DRAFT_457864 [Pilaira anomala]|nr:hypothetical protein BD770DRAFT_457864 [Pilaira anomala]